MTGNFTAADVGLADHVAHFGPTLWSARWGLTVAEESEGVELRRSMVEEYKNMAGDSGVILFSDMFSFAANKGMTENRYRTLVGLALPQDPIRPFLEFIFLTDFLSQWDTSDFLNWAECLTLIDRYELVIKFSAYVIGAGMADANRFIKAIERMSAVMDDPIVTYISESTCDRDAPFVSPSLFAAWDKYMIADYEGAKQHASTIVATQPWLVAAHEIIVKSTMHLGGGFRKHSVTPIDQIHANLYNIFSRNSEVEESLSTILRLGSRFDCISLAAPLRAIHAQHSAPVTDNKWQIISSLCCGCHWPRNFEQGHSLERNQRYLAKCKSGHPDSSSAGFFHALASGLDADRVGTDDRVPEIRRAFFGGISAARHGQFANAQEKLARFEHLQRESDVLALGSFGLEESRRTMIEVFRRNGNVSRLLQLVVTVYTERSQSVRRLPIGQIFQECLENRAEAAKYIEFPIVASLALSDPHQISLSLKRCLRANCVATPSAFMQFSTLDKQVLGVLFLRVCTPDVLDSLGSLNSANKVDTERVRLLEWVKSNVPTLSNLAKVEIATVTQNAELRDALETLNEAKVVLDLTGLRNAEQQRFNDAYTRFQDQKELANARRADVLVSALRDLRINPGVAKLVYMPNQNEYAQGAFVEAFREIRDGFLSSPYYGLEASLSGQVRHGIIIQHIRNPLLERKIAVKKGTSGYDELRRYWAEELGLQAADEIHMQAMKLLDQMTVAIDSTAQEVKEKWIQSKVENGTFGLFDYRFEAQELASLYQSLQFEEASREVFLDLVFDILLKRTRASLKVVRTEISRTLRKRLLEIIDAAISDLSAIDPGGKLTGLKNALTSCRQEMEGVICTQMVRWFQESSTSLMGDCDFRLIARTAIGMVERLNPDLRGRFRSEITSEFRVRGRHFRALVLMIFFLLDNAVQHSQISDALFEVLLTISAESNRLQVCVRGRMGSAEASTKAEQAIQDRLKQHRDEFVPERVIREGGSGLAKLIATVLYEFNQENPNIFAKSDGDNLSVNVVCEMAGIAV